MYVNMYIFVEHRSQSIVWEESAKRWPKSNFCIAQSPPAEVYREGGCVYSVICPWVMTEPPAPSLTGKNGIHPWSPV